MGEPLVTIVAFVLLLIFIVGLIDMLRESRPEPTKRRAIARRDKKEIKDWLENFEPMTEEAVLTPDQVAKETH